MGCKVEVLVLLLLLGERSEPRTGVFNRDSKKRRRNYMRVCSKSVLGGRIRPVTPVLFISTIH